MPVLSVSDVTVGEGDARAEVVVTLDAAATGKVTVNYTTEPWTAQYGDGDSYSFGKVTGTLTFNPGETRKTISVPIHEAAVYDTRYAELDARFKLVLSSPANATLAGEGYAWIHIVDNDTVMDAPEWLVSDVTVDEAAGTASFQVRMGRLFGQSARVPVSIGYSTADGTAQAGADYTAVSGTLTFQPGESVKTVTVPLLNDTQAEPDESFQLVLAPPGTGVVVKGSGVARIGANDAAATSQPRIVVSDQWVGEGDVYADVVVQLSAPGTSKVTVNYTTSSWTAIEGQGYSFLKAAGTLTFNPGETTRVVRIDLVDVPVYDTRYAELPSRFKFELSSPSNAVLSDQGYAWITVIDNDTPMDNPELLVGDVVVDEAAGVARMQVTLGRVAGQSATATVTADYATRDGSAKAGEDYVATAGHLVFLPGESVKTVTVPLLDDTTREDAEAFQLVLTDAATGVITKGSGTVTIGANDAPSVAQPKVWVESMTVGEGDIFADVIVRLSEPGRSKVTVNYATASWTAESGQGYDFIPASGTLSFDPGETVQVVRIDLVDALVYDARYAEGAERFKLVLSSPSNATLGGEGYGWVTIVDNDTAANTPELNVADAVVDESAGYADFVVTLGHAVGQSTIVPVTVDYATVDGSAKAGSDYTAARGTLTFLPGETTKTVRLKIADDGLTEPLERLGFVLSNPSSAAIADGHAAAVIVDDDAVTAAQPKVDALSNWAVEGDGSVDVLVVLSAPSARTVSVRYATQGGTASGSSDFASLSGTLEFAPGEVAKTVRIDVFADTLAEGIEGFKLVLSSPSNAKLGVSADIAILDATVGNATQRLQGLGDDVYEVTSADDALRELPQLGGNDTVRAFLDYTLPAEVENLVLAHPSVIRGTGNALANVFVGNASNNRIDGLDGSDTMVYAGPSSAYRISGPVTERSVTSAADGTDTLLSIERLQFSDTVLASDTQPGQDLYEVLALLNAAFGQVPPTSEVSRWTAEYGRLGGNLDSLAQEVINAYAPGIDNSTLVSYLWGTVVESPLSSQDLAGLVGLIQNGTYTQASLFAFAALHPLNTAELASLVGTTITLEPQWFDSWTGA